MEDDDTQVLTPEEQKKVLKQVPKKPPQKDEKDED
jgi:hypothetical protein